MHKLLSSPVSKVRRLFGQPGRLWGQASHLFGQVGQLVSTRLLTLVAKRLLRTDRLLGALKRKRLNSMPVVVGLVLSALLGAGLVFWWRSRKSPWDRTHKDRLDINARPTRRPLLNAPSSSTPRPTSKVGHQPISPVGFAPLPTGPRSSVRHPIAMDGSLDQNLTPWILVCVAVGGLILFWIASGPR